MAFERENFRSVGPGSHMLGSVVEFDPYRRPKPPSHWKWAVAIVAVTAIVTSFFITRGCFRGDEGESEPPSQPPPVQPASQTNAANQVAAATNVAASVKVEPARGAASPARGVWGDRAEGRPQQERTLLQRLDDAEMLGRWAIAVDTIEKLRARPSMADLDDKLARRLGDLNIKRLFSGEPVPWVVEAKVKAGQTVHRVAREHGTTVAAVRQLNGLEAREEPEEGRTLRVLEFPKAAFVVHKSTRYADLTLGGKLFKRYYVTTRRSTPSGAYPITSKPDEGPRSRMDALRIRVAPADMRELDMFLAPGSMLTVSEL